MKQKLCAGIIKISNLEHGEFGLWKKWNMENLEGKKKQTECRIQGGLNSECRKLRMWRISILQKKSESG